MNKHEFYKKYEIQRNVRYTVRSYLKGYWESGRVSNFILSMYNDAELLSVHQKAKVRYGIVHGLIGFISKNYWGTSMNHKLNPIFNELYSIHNLETTINDMAKIFEDTSEDDRDKFIDMINSTMGFDRLKFEYEMASGKKFPIMAEEELLDV